MDTDGLGLMALMFGMVQAVLLGMFKFLERIFDKRDRKARDDAGFLGRKLDSGDLGKLVDLTRMSVAQQKDMIDSQERMCRNLQDDHRRIIMRLDDERSNP